MNRLPHLLLEFDTARHGCCRKKSSHRLRGFHRHGAKTLSHAVKTRDRRHFRNRTYEKYGWLMQMFNAMVLLEGTVRNLWLEGIPEGNPIKVSGLALTQ